MAQLFSFNLGSTFDISLCENLRDSTIWVSEVPCGNVGFAVSLSQFLFEAVAAPAAAAVTLLSVVPSPPTSVLCFFLLLSRDDDVPFGIAVSEGRDSAQFHSTHSSACRQGTHRLVAKN